MNTNRPPHPAAVHRSRGTVRDVDLCEVIVPVDGADLGLERDLDAGVGPHLIDEVAGHGLLQSVPADDERDAPGVAGEVERRLSGRVPGADEETSSPWVLPASLRAAP
jgi:hypothetical protein